MKHYVCLILIFIALPCNVLAQQISCKAKVLTNIAISNDAYFMINKGTVLDNLIVMKTDHYQTSKYLCQKKDVCFPYRVDMWSNNKNKKNILALQLLNCRVGQIQSQNQDYTIYNLVPNTQ